MGAMPVLAVLAACLSTVAAWELPVGTELLGAYNATHALDEATLPQHPRSLANVLPGGAYVQVGWVLVGR